MVSVRGLVKRYGAVTDIHGINRYPIAIGSHEGVSAAPEGGAALSAIRRLAADGQIGRKETVVLFNTGGGEFFTDIASATMSRRAALGFGAAGALAVEAARWIRALG